MVPNPVTLALLSTKSGTDDHAALPEALFSMSMAPFSQFPPFQVTLLPLDLTSKHQGFLAFGLDNLSCSSTLMA